MAKHVYKVGDRVRIIDPRRIVKIGYEKDIDSMFEDYEYDSRVVKFCHDMKLDSRATERVIRAVASSKVGDFKRSGAVRKIFYSDLGEQMMGAEKVVVRKVVRYTGEYHPSAGGWEDYDPAYLYPVTAHVVLRLCDPWSPMGKLSTMIDEDGEVEFDVDLYVTSDQVEPVQ